MSRGLRRVPVDFDWPIGKVWDGHLLPERLVFPGCRVCGPATREGILGVAFGIDRGDGLTPEARAIADTFYPHQISGVGSSQNRRVAALAWHDKLGQAEVDELVGEGRLDEWVDDPTAPYGRRRVRVPRTAAEVNVAERSHHLHDGINRFILIRFRCKVLGIEMTCPACEGDGMEATPEQKREREEWEGTEPPTGEGWQIWETVGEGRPVSPVFATSDGLVAWMTEDHPERPFQWDAMSRKGAEAFVREGRVPSGVESSGVGFEDGLAWLDREARA